MRTTINSSTKFATALAKGERYFKAYATIVLAGTLPQGVQRTYELDNVSIMQDGIKLSQSTSETNKFSVGSFILDKLELTLYNDDGRFNDPNFTDADVELTISLDGLAKNDGVKIGRFKVTDVSGRNTSLLTLTCMDYGVKFNRVYVASASLFASSTTATAIAIINDCLTQCGVTGANDIASQLIAPNEAFPNPADGEITCGQVISAIAQLNCRYVKMDADGRLNFKWYHNTSDVEVKSVFGFSYSEELHYTGIKIKTSARHYSDTTSTSGKTNYETTDYISYMGESADYCFVIENNPMLQLQMNGKGSNVAISNQSDGTMVRIWDVLMHDTFTPLTLNALWNPLIEAGDTVTTTLRIGGTKRTITTVINDVRWTVGGQATYSCEAEIPSRNVSQSMSATSVVERQLKKLLKQRADDFQNAYNNMLSDIAHATGFHVTEIVQSDGSRIEYYHNGIEDVDRDENGNIIYNEYYDEDAEVYHTEPSFSTSTFLIKHAGSVIAASTDNGETWNWAINVDGKFIAQQIAAHKLIADQAIVGDLTVRKYCDEHLYEDGDENTIMMQLTLPYIDDNGDEHYGRALLNADQISLTSGLSGGQLQTLAEAFAETAKVWFSNVEPTENNYPASNWTSDTVRLQHVGDICVNSKNGKTYRYEYLVSGQYYKFSSDSQLAVRTVASGTFEDIISIYYKYDNKYFLAGTFKGNEVASKRIFIPSNSMYIYFHSYNYVKEIYTNNTTELLNGVYLTYDSSGLGTLDDIQVESLPNANSIDVTANMWQNNSYRGTTLRNEIGTESMTFNKHNLKRTNGYTVNEEMRFNIATHTDSAFASSFSTEKYAWQEIENYDLNTPAKILEKLTDGFAMEGIYMQNGKLYINMSYLRSGAIQIANGDETILYAGYDSALQKNVLRIKADSLSITPSDGGSYTTVEDMIEGEVNQEKIVKLLNDGSLTDGFYISGGRVYLSFSYAKGGELALGGAVSGSSTDESENTYARGKLRMYSDNNNVVGFWAGNSLIQYREKADSTYRNLMLTRTWEATSLSLWNDDSTPLHYMFREYNIVGYNKSTGVYASDATRIWNNSTYSYYTVREQNGMGYKLCTAYFEIYSSSYSHGSINDNTSSSAYTKPVVSLGTASKKLTLDLTTLTGLFGSVSGNITGLELKLAGSSYYHTDSTNHILLETEGFNRYGSGTYYYRVHTGYPWRFGYETLFDSSTTFSGVATFNNSVNINGLSTFDSTATFNQNASFLGNNFYVFYKDSSGNTHYAICKDNTALQFGLPVQLTYSLTHVTSGGHLVFASDDKTLAYLSESSKRIKDIDRKLTADDVEKMYGISVYRAKYKDDYLPETDQRYGKYYPMFIAEDVNEFFPDAVDLDEDGLPKDWNYRVLIPGMFQMIKGQKEEITELKDKVASLEDRLAKLEKLLMKES